jgi:alkyl sulfatase BDS1-like metallo-beta-lactamase superfamily hydrolase
VKATYVLYLGWFNGNPATLHGWPPVESSKRYVDFMGGADAILSKAKKSYDEGDYRWVAEVVNHVVFADPNNTAAKQMQADEQLGYQTENGPWRNFYLTGAKELRDGVKKLPTPDTASPDTVKAMTPELFFDYLSVRINRPKAGDAHMVLNVDLGKDGGGTYMLELENGVLSHTAGRQADNADVSLSMNRDALNDIILGKTNLTETAGSRAVQLTGNKAKLDEFIGYLDKFDFWFNIVTPREA